jgi:negative regulator of sigma E activity
MSRERVNDEALREELSAFMDGELDADRARFLQQRLRHDADLRARWERWHLQSSALRRQAQPLPADFADRIASKLDAEAVNAAPPRGRALRWAGGVALAASLAVAGVFVFDAMQQPQNASRQVVATPAAAPTVASIQRSALRMPEPMIASRQPEAPRIELPIPVHDGVVGAFRSPLRPVWLRQRRPVPRFSPFPQPFAIDPELAAYLEQQKSGGLRDPFARRFADPADAGDSAVRSVAYPQDDTR